MLGIEVGDIFSTGCQRDGNLKRYRVDHFMNLRRVAKCTITVGPNGKFVNRYEWAEISCKDLLNKNKFRRCRRVP